MNIVKLPDELVEFAKLEEEDASERAGLSDSEQAELDELGKGDKQLSLFFFNDSGQ